MTGSGKQPTMLGASRRTTTDPLGGHSSLTPSWALERSGDFVPGSGFLLAVSLWSSFIPYCIGWFCWWLRELIEPDWFPCALDRQSDPSGKQQELYHKSYAHRKHACVSQASNAILAAKMYEHPSLSKTSTNDASSSWHIHRTCIHHLPTNPNHLPTQKKAPRIDKINASQCLTDPTIFPLR